MTKASEDFSSFVGGLKQEFNQFSAKFAAAVKEGAEAASEQMMPSVEEFSRPSSVFAEKFAAAVKGGANVAGGQIIAAGMEFVQALFASKTNKQ